MSSSTIGPAPRARATGPGQPMPFPRATLDRLVERFGTEHRERLAAGLRRVADRWTPADGTLEELEAFCATHYVADAEERRALVDRLEAALERLFGHLYEVRRSLRWWSDVRTPRLAAIDDVLATFDPAPDLPDQLYRQKLAFVVLLNLDRPDLATMLRDGPSWTPQRWAEARIAQAFGPRIPAELNDIARAAGHAAQQWVAGFHVPVGAAIDDRGEPIVDDPRRTLIAHWLVREEIKANYGRTDAPEQALRRQRALAWIMARHVDGSIPRRVMEGGATRWDPASNRVDDSDPGDLVGPTRYAHILAQRAVAVRFDAYHPDHPTAMARKFELAREIPEADVERLIVALLEAPVRRELAAYLRSRLGRPLEPFDIYVDDVGEAAAPAKLDAAVRRRFGDEKAFQAELPGILESIGFPRSEARYIGERIVVEIARGSGHAVRPGLPEFGATLRTSRLDDELGWDGFETGMHELGHTVEQVISCQFAPRPALRGVPNTACTEAFAFLYQSLARRVIGLADDSAPHRRRAAAIDSVQTMLNACQIAGPSLVELRIWHWLYANPDARPEDLRDAAIAIAEEVWQRWFAVDFGPDPYRLLAAYQHMVNHPLYLADYTLGHIMSHQIRSYMADRDLASETRRICSIGRVTPDLWMRTAVGAGISVDPLVRDAAAGVAALTA
ncbi:MAG TPA: hypothetical protein PKC43_11265 [Phycisphaerales bacterium]|nr:hypothetical protein [Phycisphaerales bacterium]